jgi:hypothetical protein
MIFGSFHTGQSLAKSQQDKFYKDLGGTAFTGSGSKWGNIGGFVYQID